MRLTNLTVEERENVEKLRELVKDELSDYYNTDFNLLRWLQGNFGTIDLVAAKLKTHLKARKSVWNMDTLSCKPRNHPIHKHWVYGITGLSHTLPNVIVNIEQCGKIDYWGMIQTYSINDVLRARIPDLEHMLNRVMQIEEETGKQAHILYIMDLTDLQYNAQLYQLVIGPLKSLSEFMAEHYVELVKYFLLVNVPSFVYALWTVVKPLLPERTRSKVRILSSSDWRTEVLEYACKESLAAEWNTSDEVIFASHVSVPLKISKIDYYRNTFGEVPEGVERIKIPAGKIFFITQQLKSRNQLNFWIQADMDFGFGIFRTDDDKQEDLAKMDTIYPCFGWIPGPTVVPFQDSVTVSEPGVYKIYLSNAKAWWNSLTVQIVLTYNDK